MPSNSSARLLAHDFRIAIFEICPFRSRRPDVFYKKAVLRNFAKFTGKHNFIKLETLAQVFSCEFCEISKNIFSYRTPLVVASVHCWFWGVFLLEMKLSNMHLQHEKHLSCSFSTIIINSYFREKNFSEDFQLRSKCASENVTLSKYLNFSNY